MATAWSTLSVRRCRQLYQRSLSTLFNRGLDSRCLSTTIHLPSKRTISSPPYLLPRRFASSKASDPTFHSTGLFSIPELQRPGDFMKLAGEAIEICNSVRQDLRSQLDTPVSSQNRYQAQEYLFQLDHISKTVCNVIDAAELCRSVHASAEWRDSADRAFSTLSSYIGELNADTSLYQTLLKVTQAAADNQIQPPLSEEEQRFCFLLQAEFERDGIHLEDQERREVQHLQMHVTQLETMFSQNIVNRKKHFSIDRHVVEAVIPPKYLEFHGFDDPATTTLTLSADSDIANSLSKFSANPAVRRQVYMESMTACPENLAVLDALIHLRHEVSTKLGFTSYADRFLRDKMAKNQETVFAFLHKLLETNQPTYKLEMEQLQEAKGKVEGLSNPTIEPWDVSFYTSILKARSGFDSGAISAYLTLDNCIEGIKILVSRLFGIHMIEREMTAEEAWDVLDSSQKTALRRLDFVDEEGNNLGTMYLDLQARQDKYGHAAHFTVRCGCMRESPYGETAIGDFQNPVIALVCNLANYNPASGGSSLLTHSEVETIYHELGHMLHSMLSRTKFQHMSGTRAPMDFVETPSHWLENFVWDPEFLRILGRHHETGESIPDNLIAQLRHSRHSFHAIERQNQIIYALFDQQIFGVHVPPDGDLSNLSKSPALCNTTEIFATLHRDNGVPYADGTHWHSRFGHLVTYGAAYYGYLYSQVFAGDIWRECFEGNSMSRAAGERIWKTMLMHGGARDPNVMLEELLGRRPRVDV